MKQMEESAGGGGGNFNYYLHAGARSPSYALPSRDDRTQGRLTLKLQLCSKCL